MVRQGPVEDIDLRIEDEITWSQPIEQFEENRVGVDEPTRVLKVGSDSPPALKIKVENFLRKIWMYSVGHTLI